MITGAPLSVSWGSLPREISTGNAISFRVFVFENGILGSKKASRAFPKTRSQIFQSPCPRVPRE